MPKKLTRRVREMREVLRELDASGLSVREFAEVHRHTESTLWRSRRRLREAEASDESLEVLPVSIRESRSPGAGLVVELAGGRRILVPASFDGDELRRLVAVIESC